MAGSPTEGAPAGAPILTPRAAETWTAAAVAAFGLLVVVESLTHDIGWNEAGPGSGYFPFRVGLLLAAAAAVRLVRVRRVRPGTDALMPFVTREGVARSLSVFTPTAVLVAAMFPLGCYVPSAAYLAWMLRRHGGRGWLPAAAFGAAVMTAFFLVFELWFRVPLAKGPLEAALGM